ncbi:MAG: GAF domain-containing protein [Anaerolineae bacterium]|nr:GAF domain-containing protein [Anaerolineae bacterium]
MSDPEPADKTEGLAMGSIDTWRRQLSRVLLRALVVVGALALIMGSYGAYAEGPVWQIAIYAGLYVILLIITFWRRVPYQVQAMVVMLLLCGFGVFNLTQFGVNAESAFFLLALPLMAALFYGRLGGRIGIIVVCLFLAIVATLFVTGQIVVPVTDPVKSADWEGWVTTGLIFLMLSIALVFAQNYLLDRLVAALTRSRALMQELEMERGGLEEAVQERTRDLARRTQYLEAAAMIARDAASELDMQGLLSRVVALISERFGFYHTSVFLLDPAGERAELRAASSEGGRRMLARGHRLQVGAEGIVGYVARQGAHRVALDVGKDAVHFDNPDLPDTRSEIALPLRARGEIIGVLDVQSTEPEAFSGEDVTALQALADQVAVAISNARLFQQVEESVVAERRAYGELSQRAWRALLHEETGLGFYSSEHGITPAGDMWLPEMDSVLRTGEMARGDDGDRLAIPIKIRDQVIGVIDGRKPDGAGTWTQEEIELLQVLTERLGLALEGARLYRDSQRREARERTVGRITARVRETLDMDTVLKVAVQELRRSLGLPEVVIRLAPGKRGQG